MEGTWGTLLSLQQLAPGQRVLKGLRAPECSPDTTAQPCLHPVLQEAAAGLSSSLYSCQGIFGMALQYGNLMSITQAPLWLVPCWQLLEQPLNHGPKVLVLQEFLPQQEEFWCSGERSASPADTPPQPPSWSSTERHVLPKE